MIVQPEPSRLTHLVQTHQRGVWRYLRFLGCDPDQAEDLAQETFLEVWKRPFQVHAPAATAAYLRRVARNLFLKTVRRSATGPVWTDLQETEPAWLRFERDDGGEAYLEALRTCLEAVTPRARQALELTYGRDRRSQAIEALGLSPDGLKSLLQRAKDQLKACIQRKVQA